MASGVQDFNRTESDRLNEIKGHLEIALLEKHFLRKYEKCFMERGCLRLLKSDLMCAGGWGGGRIPCVSVYMHIYWVWCSLWKRDGFKTGFGII